MVGLWGREAGWADRGEVGAVVRPWYQGQGEGSQGPPKRWALHMVQAVCIAREGETSEGTEEGG